MVIPRLHGVIQITIAREPGSGWPRPWTNLIRKDPALHIQPGPRAGIRASAVGHASPSALSCPVPRFNGAGLIF